MITIKDLTTGYSRDKPLLQNFNYSFTNKIYGILGASGCGKTTLLRTIAGLMKPLQGEILVNEQIVAKTGTNDIYMMHQNYTSFDWLTCLDNVLIAKSIKGKVTNNDIFNASSMLKSVGLLEYKSAYPKQLSGGMRQRLALARTLFMNPPILLMDEPLSALDGDTREMMQNLILQQHRKIKNTIIMVTHSTEEAGKMCDKIIHL